MFHEFVTSNRTELIARCRNKVEKRLSPSEIPLALDHGVPLFLQQLVETLRLEQREPHPAAFEVLKMSGAPLCVIASCTATR